MDKWAIKTYLVVDLARGYSCIAEILWVTIGGVEAAGGRDTIGGVIHTAKPAGVVIHSTATQLNPRPKKTTKTTQKMHLFIQVIQAILLYFSWRLKQFVFYLGLQWSGGKVTRLGYSLLCLQLGKGSFLSHPCLHRSPEWTNQALTLKRDSWFSSADNSSSIQVKWAITVTCLIYWCICVAL